MTVDEVVVLKQEEERLDSFGSWLEDQDDEDDD